MYMLGTVTSIHSSDLSVSQLSRKNNCWEETGLQRAPAPGAVHSIKRAR